MLSSAHPNCDPAYRSRFFRRLAPTRVSPERDFGSALPADAPQVAVDIPPPSCDVTARYFPDVTRGIISQSDRYGSPIERRRGGRSHPGRTRTSSERTRLPSSDVSGAFSLVPVVRTLHLQGQAIGSPATSMRRSAISTVSVGYSGDPRHLNRRTRRGDDRTRDWPADGPDRNLVLTRMASGCTGEYPSGLHANSLWKHARRNGGGRETSSRKRVRLGLR